jgi:catalase
MIPGIEASPDKVLQGRLMSYLDAHRHRLGANYEQLPVNMACNAKVNNYQKDGPARIYNQGGAPNYWPNSFSGPAPDASFKSHEPTTDHGEVGLPGRYNDDDDDNYSECAVMYNKVFDEGAKDRLTTNIAGHLGGAAEFIQERMIQVLKNVDPDYGQRVQDKIAANKNKPEPEEKDDRKPAPLNPPRTVPQKK